MSLHDPISPLRALYVQKVLPAVYDDSLSYYEVLAKTQEKLNEVISDTNDVSALVLELQQAMNDFIHGGYLDSFEDYLDEWFEDNAEEFVQRLVDEGVIPEVEDLQSDIDSVHGDIADLVASDASIRSDLAAAVAELQSEDTAIRNDMGAADTAIRSDMNAADLALANTKVPYPLVGATPSYGTSGQVLSTNADGTTDWQDPVVPSDAQAEQVITQWLDQHPEATTTVQDGAITTAKLADGAVTDEKLVQSGGVLGGLLMDSKGMSQFLRPTNLIVPSECVDNCYVNQSNGSLRANDGYFSTGFIPVTAGETYKSNMNGRTHAWYDSSKTFISGSDSENFKEGVTAPSGASYLRFSIRKSQDTTTPYKVYIAKSSLYDESIAIDDLYVSQAAFADTASVADMASVADTAWSVPWIARFPDNLIVPSECVDNCYVNQSNGSLRANDGYFSTGFIPVTAGETYKSNMNGRTHAWYDSSKTFISGSNSENFKEGVTAPSGASYLRFSVRKSSDTTDPHDVYFAQADNYNNKVVIPNLYVVAEAKAWCFNKTINWIGDSIVDGRDFDEYVCSNLQMTKLTTDGVNGGINGSTIALDSDGNDGRHALCLRYVDMPENADIIAVSCGTNDWMYAWCPIGDMSSTANNRFYGALKTLCAGLIDMYPQKVIFFTTPIKRAQAFANGAGGTYTPDGINTNPSSKNKYGLTLGDYCNIIKEVCAYYSIPVLDMYNESLLNPNIISQQNMFDSALTHPNTDGQKIMARRVCGWLTQLGYNIS